MSAVAKKVKVQITFHYVQITGSDNYYYSGFMKSEINTNSIIIKAFCSCLQWPKMAILSKYIANNILQMVVRKSFPDSYFSHHEVGD